jgi:hypothetical protein
VSGGRAPCTPRSSLPAAHPQAPRAGPSVPPRWWPWCVPPEVGRAPPPPSTQPTKKNRWKTENGKQVRSGTPRRGAQGRRAHGGSLRVRVEIMGSQPCRIVRKSQPVLMMINPMISTRTRTRIQNLRSQGACRWLGCGRAPDPPPASSGARGAAGPRRTAAAAAKAASYPAAVGVQTAGIRWGTATTATQQLAVLAHLCRASRGSGGSGGGGGGHLPTHSGRRGAPLSVGRGVVCLAVGLVSVGRGAAVSWAGSPPPPPPCPAPAPARSCAGRSAARRR